MFQDTSKAAGQMAAKKLKIKPAYNGLSKKALMSRSAQKQISRTKNIQSPSRYIQALYKNYKSWAFDEDSAAQFKGQWRKLFSKNEKAPLHLEIGPGDGRHFAKLCLNQPQDCFLAVELKYKALIQTIRRARKNNSQNGKALRYNASLIDDLFERRELNNVYIHFPDPWLKKRRQKKHQLIQKAFCEKIYKLQKPGCFLELKTDSEEYFQQSVQLFEQTGYKTQKYSSNLYKEQNESKDPRGEKNLMESWETGASNGQAVCEPLGEKNLMESLSQFELLFFQKKIPINYALFTKP